MYLVSTNLAKNILATSMQYQSHKLQELGEKGFGNIDAKVEKQLVPQTQKLKLLNLESIRSSALKLGNLDRSCSPWTPPKSAFSAPPFDFGE